MAAVRERTIDVGGIATLVRYRDGAGTPVVLWHGNPTDSADWLPFMERLDRPAYAADMPAFGRSASPPQSEFAYTMDAYAEWAAGLVDALGLERYAVAVHDWGSIGLLAALRHPRRIERILAFNVVPFGVGYRWHWIARLFWRRHVLGEVFNAGARGALPGLLLRQARPGFEPMPAELLARVAANLSRAQMRSAVLCLYRSADPERLDAAGRALARLDAPALLLWGQNDPYIRPVYGRRLAALIPGARLEEIPGAGHWAWLDRPDLVRRAVDFLAAG